MTSDSGFQDQAKMRPPRAWSARSSHSMMCAIILFFRGHNPFTFTMVATGDENVHWDYTPWREWTDEGAMEPSVEEWQRILERARRELRHELQRLQSGLLLPWNEVDFCVFEIICLVSDVRLQRRLRRTAAGGASMIEVSFDFLAFDATIDALVAAGVIDITRDTIVAGIDTIGHVLGHFETIERLRFGKYLSLPHITTILDSCHHVQKLTMWGAENDDAATGSDEQTLTALQTCLQQLQSLKGAQFDNVDNPTLEVLGLALPLCSELNCCRLVGGTNNESVSLQGGMALGNISRMASLSFLELTSFAFESTEEVKVICDGLLLSSNLALYIESMQLPADADELLANALVHLDQLFIKNISIDLYRPRFLETLGRNMCQKRCKLRVLRVGTYHVKAESTAVLSVLFRYARNWKLQQLTINSVKWTPEFDQMMATYLGENSHLRKLEWTVANGVANGPLAQGSEAFLEALDRPGQRLGEITLRGFVDEYVERVDFILELNHQRHRHGPRLSKVTTAEQFVQVLQELDDDYLFEFLHRNEFNFLELLRKYGYRS